MRPPCARRAAEAKVADAKVVAKLTSDYAVQRDAAPGLGEAMTAYRIHREKTIWQVLDDGAVLINTDTSAYYSLNPTGTEILGLFADESRRLDDVARWARDRYGIPHDVATRDIAALLDGLTQAGLIVEVGSEAAVPLSRETTAGARPQGGYETPVLTRHGELEKLILSGE